MSREEHQALLRALEHRERSERQELQTRFDLLTVRERQVLANLMRGRTVRDIAGARAWCRKPPSARR